LFSDLPTEVQRAAERAYQLWRVTPYHSSLQFKRVHARDPIYSVRIGIGWRALGVMADADVIWYWIGSHSDYDKILSQS
jgi:hypothetical protein